jgi:hypothetical protein
MNPFRIQTTFIAYQTCSTHAKPPCHNPHLCEMMSGSLWKTRMDVPSSNHDFSDELYSMKVQLCIHKVLSIKNFQHNFSHSSTENSQLIFH